MRHPHVPPRQRGAAALGITVLLLFVMLLALGALDRNLVFEHRASVNQYRATQAFEAADAGLEWALARLDDERAIGADCAPTAAPGATSFREQRLAWNAASASIAPLTWLDAGLAVPVAAACVRTAEGWSCDCPTAARPALVAPPAGPAPAFSVRFQPSGRAGVVRAVSIGCTSWAAPCADAADTSDASTRIEALFALLPGLRTAPAAPLTVRGRIDADAASFGAHNADAGAGVTLHAGGVVRASRARLDGPPGTPPGETVAANDAALAGLAAPRLFSSLFGLDPDAWSRLPGVRHLRCPDIGDCTEALREVLGVDRGVSIVRVEGDLAIEGPVPLGSAARPIVVVATGAVRLHGGVDITGLLYAGSIAWNAAPGLPGIVRGALVSEGDYVGDAAPELLYDAAVLARLRGWSGTFVRVPGSWKDF